MALSGAIGILTAQEPGNIPAKVDPRLWEKAGSTGEETTFLVLFHAQADVSGARELPDKATKAGYVHDRLQAEAQSVQASLAADLQAAGVPFRSLHIVNALVVRGDRPLITTLALRPEISAIIENAPLRSAEPGPVGAVHAPPHRGGPEWGLTQIHADEVWAMGYQGQGVVIGGQDTGFDWTHPAIRDSYRGYHAPTDTVDHSYHWHDAIHQYSPLNSDTLNPCGLDVSEPCDDNNHGTHTMGTMVGLDGANIIGVAPAAKWCACRNMERGWGDLSTYLECFQWFLAPTDPDGNAPDPAMAPHVINNSWYCPEQEGCNPSNFEILGTAVDNLRAAGTVVVVSAGNSGSGCGSVSSPAAIFEGSFTVGATAQNDTIAGFSSRGPVLSDGSGRMKPNVSAPGVGVRSCIPGGGYAAFSGTSMAGPHVAGLVALVISANPALAGQVEVIEDLIEQTAVAKYSGQDCGDLSGQEAPNNTYGFGRVDALAAVTAALAVVGAETPSDPGSEEVAVYPNPFEETFLLSVPVPIEDARLRLFDSRGREVYRWRGMLTGPHEMATADLPAGMYIYTLRSGKETWTGKVVKK